MKVTIAHIYREECSTEHRTLSKIDMKTIWKHF